MLTFRLPKQSFLSQTSIFRHGNPKSLDIDQEHPLAMASTPSVHMEPMPVEGVRVRVDQDVKGKGRDLGFQYAGFVAGIASVSSM